MPPADPLTGKPDPAEKQTFWWFHDHYEGHTGANVYKGMVGLMPIHDPGVDSGDERTGLRLPGVRRDHADGTFDVDYDIPLALFDCRLDDGVTPHQDCHNGFGQVEAATGEKRSFVTFPITASSVICSPSTEPPIRSSRSNAASTACGS
jgi:hypothetical protein